MAVSKLLQILPVFMIVWSLDTEISLTGASRSLIEHQNPLKKLTEIFNYFCYTVQ